MTSAGETATPSRETLGRVSHRDEEGVTGATRSLPASENSATSGDPAAVGTLDPDLQTLAEQIARLVAEPATTSPWMDKTQAIAYSRLRQGTFEKLAADGRIPSHGGKRKVFHQAEVDDALRRL